MPGRLGIDFGTSNTVFAVWNPAKNEADPLHLPDYGRPFQYRQGTESTETISVVPSLIHYTESGQRWLGQQVLDRDLYDSPRTFRWMKRYISRRSPIQMKLDGRSISHADAGQDFLTAVLTFVAAELELREEEVAFTVPVEAFEHYENWLLSVAERTGLRRFRLLDEPSAAALGYGARLRPDDAYLVFDFGGGTLDVSVILLEGPETPTSGRRCRVLGKAGADVGGATIDGWIYQDLLRQAGCSDADEDVREISRTLLVECERVKELLSFQEHAEIQVTHPRTGHVYAGRFTRAGLEELLDDHDAFHQVDVVLRRALTAARERGYSEDHIQAALLIGGSSLIPSVRRHVQRFFGRDRVWQHRPFDAVARGAAAFVAGIDFDDHIQHDYAIRFIDPRRGEYAFRPLVARGTAYPSREPLARLIVKGSHDGQTQLGIAIFELGDSARSTSGPVQELVFDPSGAARMSTVTTEEEERRSQFWINEDCPTFLRADPPATKGEPRFEVEFAIDPNKRLLLTARDLTTKRVLYRDHPVIQLT